MPCAYRRQLPPALPGLGRSATITPIIQYQNHFRARSHNVLFPNHWRQRGKRAKHIVATAQLHNLADEVPVVHRVIRIAPNLNKDPRRYTAMLGQAMTTRCQGRTKAHCLRPRHRRRPGPVTNLLEGQRNFVQVINRQGLNPQAKLAKPLHILPRGAAAPSENEVRLQGHHPFKIQTEGVANQRQTLRRDRVVAVGHHADQVLAGTGGINQFGEVGRQTQ